ncbi:MAG: deoxyribodipyrimidine photo-lyase [Ketobacteraceae bacterium]|nr:deoxyribodipyrimidine photo-lyase [Ketobacteraceae bacterium]
MTSDTNKTTALVWFRRDLRVYDHPALTEACRNHKQVMGVYLHTPTQWDRHDVGNNHRWFLLEHLRDLRQSLDKLNIPLVVISRKLFSDSAEALVKLALKHDVSHLYLNGEWEVNELERDSACKAALEKEGIGFHKSNDQTIMLPGTITTNDGHYYKVFTPFRKAFIKAAQGFDFDPLPRPSRRKDNITISERDQGSIPKVKPDLKSEWTIGEAHARHALKAFVQKEIFDYKRYRDFPALDNTSRLSPYLAVGALSLRECFYEALRANDYSFEGVSEGAACWVSELIWREFYKHLMVGFPKVCKHRAFNADYSKIPWRSASKDFAAWCEGRTGYPLVDAAMKQLVQEGWMHNRLRMVVAMFLTKHLLIDWREGERFFARHLVDLDFSANNGGWQWSASTGADAAPYFRIFNPVRQSERFDPDGEFIRHYLPELASLSNKSIHAPSPMEATDLGYPQVITDHSFAVDRAKQTFRTAKEQQQYATEQAV